MKRASSLVLPTVVFVALLLMAQPGYAQSSALAATRLFETSVGNERNALAFHDATQRIYTLDALDQMRSYALDGSGLLGPVTLTSPGRSGETGLHFLREATPLGGSVQPPGTLVFIQAGVGNDPQDVNETTLYAVDETTGAVAASESVVTGLVVPPAGCNNVLKDQAKGLGYSTLRDGFVSLDINCQGIVEIEDGAATGFFPVPGGVGGSSGGGGVAVHPLDGHVWLAGALSDGNLAEFSQLGALLRRFEVFDVDTGLVLAPRRLEFDATGERLFLLTFSADVYVVVGSKLTPVPALAPWALSFLIGALAVCALVVGPRKTSRA